MNFRKNAKKIVIIAPANTATGGPELLHQLASKLQMMGEDCVMYYYPHNAKNPVHENYQEYGIEFTRKIADTPDTVVITPETMLHILRPLNHVTRVIWWLSVDNYFLSSRGLSGKIKRLVFRKSDFLIKWPKPNFNKQCDIHLVQSQYALEFVSNFGAKNVLPLSDYLHKSFFYDKSNGLKKPIIAYNPTKGTRFTNKVIKYCSGYDFVPILNMTRAEVNKLLEEAMVYIDFGNHPGKDRIPREAAIKNCCVITGRRGSAANTFDIKIPEKYKFYETIKSLKAIKLCINECLISYEDCKRDFSDYREAIEREEEVFSKDLINLLRHVQN